MMAILILLALLTSCSPSATQERDIYLVSVADDFYGYNGSHSKLGSVVTDQAALISQFQTLGDVHVTAFISQDGKRYVSSYPLFGPVDRAGNILSSPESPSFSSFRYSPRQGEEERNWTMRDVLEALESIPAQMDDLVIFTYSGHGEEGTGNLITNASPGSDLYETMGVSNVLDSLEEMGGNKLLFIDACYSGFFVPTTKFFSMDLFSDERETECVGSSHINAFCSALEGKVLDRERDRVWVMSASTSGQVALDSLDYGEPRQGSYGAFTYHLLKALGYDMEANEARESHRTLTFYSLFADIRKSYPEEEIGAQTPQVSRKRLDVLLN